MLLTLSRTSRVCSAIFLASLVAWVRADDAAAAAAADEADETQIDPGHSAHGEAFNEGPRQGAYLIGGTGDVHFPCTCRSPEVQAFIDQGVGQLHGFWYYEAERSFRQAAKLDPDCAIAYWGMAMANVPNKKTPRAAGFIAEAVKRKDLVTRREQMYIDAVAAFRKPGEVSPEEDKRRRQNFVKAYENIVDAFPDDIEAKAFLGVQLYDNKTAGIAISSYFAVDALLQQVLAVNPMHPVHHYRIHLWDQERSKRALDSAAKYGPAQPAIAHAWHMPGHIYFRLKRYNDAAWQQEASARVDHAHMMQDHILPDQIHNYAHNNEWLIRDLVHIGRAHDALDLAKNMIDLPRHPAFNTLNKNAKSGSAKYGRLRMFQVLEEFELWPEALALAETRYLEATADPEEQLKRDRLIIRAAFESGQVERGEELLAELKDERAALEQERDAEVARAERILKLAGQPQELIDETKENEAKEYDAKIEPLDKALRELEGFEHAAHQRWEQALASFKEVKNAPGSLLATLQFKAGHVDEALSIARKEVSKNEKEVIPLAQQVWLLWSAGKKEDARVAFEKLRALSVDIDLDIPLFARLGPIATELGWPADWRQPLADPGDLGERPPLDSLGPFRWSPTPAASWTLKDATGVAWSLDQYRGRPVVVIFYLGHGCVHCAKQLQTFAPMADAFREAGIELIALSTDNPADLRKSQAVVDGEFPIPLVSNASLDVFKLYRCYDDFEEKPLHGTFLIDAGGRVRWQDIGYEPFTGAKFLLAEAQRLFSEGPVDPETSAATSTTTSKPDAGKSIDETDEEGSP